jgi:putative transposase
MRYGYRRIAVLLRREGLACEGQAACIDFTSWKLAMRLKPPRRPVMAKQRDDRSNANGRNQVWGDGLDAHELFDGRRI